MRIPHPIPYQGSKRNLADRILRFFPDEPFRLVEPFAGSAAVSIASAFYFKAEKFWLNDINEPLIELWREIINRPEHIIKKYHDLWLEQLGNEEAHYYAIRSKFNETKRPEYLLFLLAKCVKSAIRYNSNGEFNQSPDKRRKGRKPENMRNDILNVSKLFKGKVKLTTLNYHTVIDQTLPSDFVYLDPPYQGTGKSGGFRYFQDVRFEDFIVSLFALHKRKIPFLLSYDGRTGQKVFGAPLPKELNLTKVEINAGRSSIATLHNRKVNTFEALYISESLRERINMQAILYPPQTKQPSLFD
ncbi:MAG: DNA adenine methylase [Bacteroidetes bacterium]|nr:MAG: DNA adenine methylase [Bacteroidota bacterium]